MPDGIKAYELAKEQREIAVSEFFEKNRHLLGFDSPVRALLTTVKELVDNSLDATDDMRVLPEIKVQITKVSENRFIVSVEDNGPGIVKEQIPRIFAKLLYGSKFFKIKESRGQQGIGVSASVLYSQLTTGKSAKITSKIGPKQEAHYYELHIDTQKNEPEILKEDTVSWEKDHGTKVEIELEAEYLKGKRSVDEYLKQTAMVNPHLRLIYVTPEKEKITFPRATEELPIEPKAIKPHPYGIELGILIRMLKSSKHAKLKSFLMHEFCRVSSKIADEILKKANLPENALSKRIARQEADNLLKSIKQTKIMAPPTNCLSPIGSELLEKGLRKEVNAEFYTTITRPPSVYRGFPFLVEAGICYGGDLPQEKSVRLLRFANKVPLLHQQSACAITKAISTTNWRSYGLQQSGNNMPIGQAVIVVHIASVWVPFTSESKEAIAHYPEIVKEIKLAVQECGRQLNKYISRRLRKEDELKKKSYIEKYIPHIGIALQDILGFNEKEEEKLVSTLKEVLEKSRKM